MNTAIARDKSILLVEDLEQFYGPILRWLKEEGYRVTLATNLTKALTALEVGHYHLAIVDIRLQDNDNRNEDGMKLLETFEERGLKDVIPCIVLTAYANLQTILTATQQRQVARYIEKKPGYRTALLTAVKDVFFEKVKINFSLTYELDSQHLVREISRDINWSAASNPDVERLVPQINDLFGKLFFKARRLHISKLRPGLTGAAVVKAIPTYRSPVSPRVVKIGLREKIQLEYERYEEFVKSYLPPNTTAQVEVSYTQHLGALLYQFAESDYAPLVEFDDFYKNKPSDQIIESLRSLFHDTFRYSYDNFDKKIEDLPRVYYDAFQLKPEKLVTRIQIVLPEFDPQQETYSLPGTSFEAINPVAWLKTHKTECQMPIYFCITHGDLTGRNIMVTDRGRCWLIDFYRTYESHILRDLVVLETDLKYRLLSAKEFDTGFLTLEAALLNEAPEKESESSLGFSQELEKARQTIVSLRKIAYEFLRDPAIRRASTRREYLVSLLMATLNVVRLRHISEERKLQAMLSASLICAELDRLAGRGPGKNSFGNSYLPSEIGQSKALNVSTPSISRRNELSRQQQYLADYLNKGKLNLFVGSGTPYKKDWPTIEAFAQQLMETTNVKGQDARRLFTIYLRQLGSRGNLTEKLVQYFDSQKRPVFFDLVTELKWRAIYTTNQHTYLQSAYDAQQLPCQIITSPKQFSDIDTNIMTIYKIFGCLSIERRYTSYASLPLEEADYNQNETLIRIQQFLEKIMLDTREGNLLLMVYPSERELSMAHEWVRSLGESGYIWVAGSDFSEDDQDYHRGLNLRVLPDDPVYLLGIFSQLGKGSI